MAKVLQLRRGTTAQNDAFTGAEGEVTVDTEKKTLRVHDGATAGGTVLAKKSEIPDITGKADKASLAPVATSGSYADLTNKPTIPTKVSAFENDKGYLTEHQSLEAYATKASLATVATSGKYADLSGTPTIPDISGKADKASLAAVATTGAYDDLTGKPTLGALAAKDKVAYGTDITGTPTIPTKVSAFENDKGYLTSHQSLDAYATKASLATVATSGSYADLTNKPTIPTIPTKVSAFENDKGYLTQHQSLTAYAKKTDLSTVATSGSYTDLSNKPTLATVATSGSYNDLTGKPTIPKITSGTTDLTAGSSALATGDIYLVYE